MQNQLNRKPSRQLRYPKKMPNRPIASTRKEKQRREKWEKWYQALCKAMTEYLDHAVKTIIGVVVLALMAQLFGINVKETTQLILDSLKTWFLN